MSEPFAERGRRGLFRSVFSRLAAIFVLIVVISFSLIAYIVISITGDYARTEKTDNIIKTAEAISNIIRVTSADLDQNGETQDLSVDTYRAIITVSASADGVNAFIADPDGMVLFCDTGMKQDLTGARIADDALLSGVRTGETYCASSDLGGVLPHTSLVAARMIGDSPDGIVVVYAESRAETAMLNLLIRTIVLSTMWVLIAMLLAIFFVSERTIGPLKTMSRAAKQFAGGRLDVRVPVTGHDEIAELASTFNNMAESLANSEKTRSSFLGNVSHDLRTPMTTISGFIDGILDGTIPPEDQEYYLKIVSSEVKRLSRLVSALLDISRLQAGERKFHPENFDICEMARQIVLSFEQLIEDKRLDVSFEAERDSMMAYADRDAIHQVLYNITDNAVKFSCDEGLLRIKIYLYDKQIHVSVYNEGVGIPKEDLPFVFDRFYKSDKSRSLDRTGVGLGLYICRSVIEAHGGTIVARSEAGKYCEFEFTLRPGKETRSKTIDITRPVDL